MFKVAFHADKETIVSKQMQNVYNYEGKLKVNTKRNG